MGALTKIFHTREPSENTINVRFPNSYTMASTHQSQIPLKKLSIQAKHAEISLNLHSSLLSIGKLYDDGCIVTFDKHKFIVSKNNYIIIEGYQDPTNGLWRLPLHHPSQNKKQANMLEPHLCKHIRPMAPQHPRAFHPTSQQDLDFLSIRSCADQQNAPCSRQSRMDPLKHNQDSQRNSFQSISHNQRSQPKGTWTSRINNQRHQLLQM